MKTKLMKIAEIARTKPKEKFTSLYHLLNEDMLLMCHNELKGNKAVGIDSVTKEKYSENLESNIKILVSKLKTKSYRPKSVKRVNIPKVGSEKKRPLGIPCYEDKLVQLGLNKILKAIYEEDFLDMSYGFRPNKCCHDALKQVNKEIMYEKVNYIVDADIKGFFDNVNHEWMIKFLKVRIADTNIIRLIQRFLKAGIMNNGVKYESTKGAPQGGVISPLLANIYLHYSLDLWFEKVVKKYLKGYSSIVRYCDDFICVFQKKEEAQKFYKTLIKRLNKFNLEIAPEKSKIIMFGRFAQINMKEKGIKGKPETFDFLGFTHYCSNSKNGKYRVKRKTCKKKYTAKLKAINEWLKRIRNIFTAEEIAKKIRIILIGYYRYYGITDNWRMLQNFKREIIKMMYKWFNRRSQRKSMTSYKLNIFLKHNPLPNPKIYVNIMA